MKCQHVAAGRVVGKTRARLDGDPELFCRMVRAIYKTQQWVQAQAPRVLADTIAERALLSLAVKARRAAA